MSPSFVINIKQNAMQLRIKYKNYEALMIHEKGNRTSFGCDFAAEALRRFKESKTAVRMVLFISTHNNTRLKKYAEYGKEFTFVI